MGTIVLTVVSHRISGICVASGSVHGHTWSSWKAKWYLLKNCEMFEFIVVWLLPFSSMVNEPTQGGILLVFWLACSVRGKQRRIRNSAKKTVRHYQGINPS